MLQVETIITNCHGFRNILFKATNAGSQDELLFFSPSVPGNESFQVFIGNLLIKTMKVSEPLLFVSEQYEDKHLAPWLEIRAEIIKIPDQEDGRIDTKVLKCLLGTHTDVLYSYPFYECVSFLF